MKFLLAGARPNFMKIAPIRCSTDASHSVDCVLVHTGQHYDYEMSQSFFKDLEIPEPNYFLDTGSGTHAAQTAKIMTAFEKVFETERPDAVVVVGEVNSTLACSIWSPKKCLSTWRMWRPACGVSTCLCPKKSTANESMSTTYPANARPPLWDGKASERILRTLLNGADTA